MYLQVGAVSVVSQLTNTCIQQITGPQAAAVAALKTAASASLKSFYAAQSNATLAKAYTTAQSSYVNADAALIQSQIATAGLLAFYVGIFSFGIGFLKLGSIMNFMGPPVISGFSTAAASASLFVLFFSFLHVTSSLIADALHSPQSPSAWASSRTSLDTARTLCPRTPSPPS